MIDGEEFLDISIHKEHKIRNDTLILVFNEEFFKNLQMNLIQNLDTIISGVKLNNVRNLEIELPEDIGYLKMNITNISVPIISMSDEGQLVKFVNTDES